MVGVFEKDRPLDLDFDGSVNQHAAEMGDYALVDIDCFFFLNNNSNDDDNKCNQEQNDVYISAELLKPSPDETSLSRLVDYKDLLIKVGDGYFSGLELATRFLSKGDCALLRCHSKYAHPDGRKSSNKEGDNLPPNTNVFYRIYLRSIISLGDAQGLSFRFKWAKQLKAIGNDYFKFEWVREDGGIGKTKCLKAYGDAAEELQFILNVIKEDETDKSGDLKQNVLSLLVDCFNNIAAVHLRDKKYGKAKEFSGKAISIDQNNVKALCRAAKASMLSGAFEECKLALEALAEIDGGNKDVQMLQMEYERRIKAYNKKEKAMYTKMMKGDNNAKTTVKLCDKAENEDDEDKDSSAIDSFTESYCTDNSPLDLPDCASLNTNGVKRRGTTILSTDEEKMGRPRVWSQFVFFTITIFCALLFQAILKNDPRYH